METEVAEQQLSSQQSVRESSVPEAREEIPETFPGHEALPSVNEIIMFDRKTVICF